MVKVVPVLAESVEEISKDIAEQDLDGVLLCGASPRVDADLYRFPPHNGQAIQVGHVNLREQCVLCFPTSSDNSFPLPCWSKWRGITSIWELSGCKTGVSEPAIVRECEGFWLSAAAGPACIPRFRPQKVVMRLCLSKNPGRYGGAVNNIPVASPLSPPGQTSNHPICKI